MEASPEIKVHYYRRTGASWPTVVLFFIFVLGVPLNFCLVAKAVISYPLGVLAGLALYNCAFTIWHEAAHGNISRRAWVNDAIGFVSSVVNLLPAFFRQRHDHLLHHRHLLDIEYDRTVYRARGPWWHLARSVWDEMRTYSPYQEKYGLKSPSKLKLDRLSYLLVLGFAAAAVVTGNGWTFLFCCFLPRVIILPIHVFYVCYLPHVGLPKDRNRGTRTLNFGLLRYFIFFHNFHAVHHLWPNIPWYAYPEYFARNRDYMQSRSVEIEIKPWHAPIFGNESWQTGEQTSTALA